MCTLVSQTCLKKYWECFILLKGGRMTMTTGFSIATLYIHNMSCCVFSLLCCPQVAAKRTGLSALTWGLVCERCFICVCIVWLLLLCGNVYTALWTWLVWVYGVLQQYAWHNKLKMPSIHIINKMCKNCKELKSLWGSCLVNDAILNWMWFSDAAADVLPDVWWKSISASNAFIICWLDITVHLK